MDFLPIPEGSSRRPYLPSQNEFTKVTYRSRRSLAVGDLAQVKRFDARQRRVTERREGDAAARVLDARPRQGGVEVVATVHEHRPGLELVADSLGSRRFL